MHEASVCFLTTNRKETDIGWHHHQFLNLPFLANFYKLTGMSGTYYYQVLTNLPICNLFFCYPLQLIFFQCCKTYFSDIFWKYFFHDNLQLIFLLFFATYFCQSCRIIFPILFTFFLANQTVLFCCQFCNLLFCRLCKLMFCHLYEVIFLA